MNETYDYEVLFQSTSFCTCTFRTFQVKVQVPSIFSKVQVQVPSIFLKVQVQVPSTPDEYLYLYLYFQKVTWYLYFYLKSTKSTSANTCT